MAIESDGHSQGNPRLYEIVEHTPKSGDSPTIWAWPEIMDWFRVAGQPVPGPWPPHQQPRPDPEAESAPVAVAEPERAEGPRHAEPERAEPKHAEPEHTEGEGKSTSRQPPSHLQGRGYLDTH